MTNTHRGVLFFCFFLCFSFSGGILCTSDSVSAGAVLGSDDLTYKGAFKYPQGDEWAYSGQALTYYPGGDPSGASDGLPGSLYAAGSMNNEIGDLVGEISIPAPVISDNFDALPRATVLQPLTDITGGWKDNCTYNGDCIYRDIGGLAYLPEVNKIAWNLNDWYNVAAYDQDSLGWSDLNMSGAQGVWHIGPRTDDRFHNAKTCNYLFTVPGAFADTYLGGKSLIAGNTREAGAFGGSQGPTLIASAPWNDGMPPASGQELGATCLLYYREFYDCVWESEGNINEVPASGVCDFPGYRGFDHWNGGAWIESGGKSAVLIVGRKGLGPNCYGGGEECAGDPCDMTKGYHAYPYDPRILFYDPNELSEVIQGTRDPWTVLPRETHSISDIVLDAACAEPGAAAYDGERNILYITEQQAGPNGETVVHVWQVTQSVDPVPDVKANGSDTAVSTSPSEPVSVEIGLDPGTRAGELADWWVAVYTPFAPPSNWFTHVYPTGWQLGIHLYRQAQLSAQTPVEVLNMALPAGNYTFYFAIDDPDGLAIGPWWGMDSVAVSVEQQPGIQPKP